MWLPRVAEELKTVIYAAPSCGGTQKKRRESVVDENFVFPALAAGENPPMCLSIVGENFVFPAFAAGGQIYACGGFNVRRLATMERYDPATDTWTALEAMDKYRSHHQILVLQNKIWVMGGQCCSLVS